ncbi:hypothetical protein H8B06_18610 [Sphingobacterium sp. DN00404]|uniref:Uncharacterized protein n=1 Tax=Sphingobacterium micropteri TaxID=2763501 RepID=A0ABR7YU07_9SPHI|nr:hypothetical protein [Sphingobacterium micropteri]MBD1434842.1 hypothetical protein [Sphingobacterium micropteri]
MTSDILQSTEFNNFLDSFKDSAREEISKDYFHVDVVAEAYTQGFKDGEDSSKQSFVKDLIDKQIEGYKQRYLQAYILTNNFLNSIASNGTPAESFFINIHNSNPNVIVAVKDDYLLDDEFINYAYSNIFETQSIFSNIFKKHHLEMSLVGVENLDRDLLTCDGYNYFEDIKK